MFVKAVVFGIFAIAGPIQAPSTEISDPGALDTTRADEVQPMAFPVIGPDPTTLEPLLKPMMSLKGSEVDSTMGLVVGQGLVLPNASQLTSVAPDDSTRRLQVETIGWVANVVRPEWIPYDLAFRMFAVRDAVNGADAFVSAWEKDERIFQLSVTRERIHLVTRLPSPFPVENEQQLLQQVLAFANTLLKLPESASEVKWEVRRFGGLVLGSQSIPFARNWFDSLIFLTDGSAVKFSALKYKDRTSPIQRQSGVYAPESWFPREDGHSQGK